MLLSGLDDKEKEKLLKFFLTKGKLWYNDTDGTYLFSLMKETLEFQKV